MQIDGSVSALGGAGTTSVSSNAGTPYGVAWGGDGGDGRIRLETDALVSGAPTPAAGSTGAWTP